MVWDLRQLIKIEIELVKWVPKPYPLGVIFMQWPDDLSAWNGGTRFFLGGGRRGHHKGDSLKNGFKMVSFVILSFVLGVRLVSGVALSTGNVPVPFPPPLATTECTYMKFPQQIWMTLKTKSLMQLISLGRIDRWFGVHFCKWNHIEASSIFPNHFLMLTGTELFDILVLFVVLISFQFSQF